MAKRERIDTDLDVHEPPKRKKLETFPIKVSGAKTISSSWLQNTFKTYGKVHSIELSAGEDGMTACVRLRTYEAAKRASEEMNGELVGGRKLHVELSQVQDNPQPTEVVAKGPVHSSQGAPTSATTTTISTTQQQLLSLKLTNIPLTTPEATLLEKCGALEGFSSLKLVKVGNSTTNYAWVNYSAPHAMSAQKVLDGMVVDGNQIKASQPRPSKFPLKSLTEEPQSQVAVPLPSSEFSFKLPDSATPPSSSASCAPLTTSMFHSHTSPSGSSRSPSPGPGPSLFKPAPCGLSLPSAHSMVAQSSPPKPHAQAQSNASRPTHSASSSKEMNRLATEAETAQPVRKQTKSQVSPGAPIPFEQSGGSRKLEPELPALKHSQTLPVAVAGETACSSQPPPSLFKPVTCGLSLPSAHNVVVQGALPKPHVQKMLPKPPLAQSNASRPTHSASSSKGEKDRLATEAETSQPVHKQTKSQLSPGAPIPFEQTGGSRKLEPKQPALKHSQTLPVAVTGNTASKTQTGPPEETDVKHSESSKQNPFKQALAKRSSVSQPMKSANTEHIEKPAPKVTESLTFSEVLIKRIIVTSEYRSELSSICEASHVDISGEEGDGLTLTLSCRDPLSLRKARDKIMALEQRVKTRICDRTFTVHCCFLPCLADSETIGLLQAIEKEDAVEFLVITTSRQFKLSECKQHLWSVLSETGTPLQLSSVTQFTENRVAYQWKVIDSRTKNEISFDSDVNESINASYIHHEATCSFEYKGHSYTVDFARMILIDKTCKEEHKIVREPPMWRYWKDDDFGFQPLSDVTSNRIEQIFQHGAPGFVEIEGEECVFNFRRDPMYVQSIKRNEHVFIQRDPSALFKEHVVTVRVRGLFKLSSVEEKFCHTLKERIISETIEIPSKMNTGVFQNLFLNMVHQYCVECTFSQNEALISLKGAKENTTGVKTCLQQAFIKILLENNVSNQPFPPEWDPQSENIALCAVAEGVSEWRHIVKLTKESMPNVKVKKIERIQNKSLWQKYEFFKSRMEKATHGSGVNEKELFHGTKKTHPSQIYESDKGFDFRFGSERSLWGQGTYFAVKASYSDRNYAHIAPDGSKQLLLAKVVTGDSKYMSSAENLKLPPLKPGKMIERYDTVHATTGGSTVYVVYDHEKAYPAYIISYCN